MSDAAKYQDIGHRDKWDQLWILRRDGRLQTSKRVSEATQEQPHTHASLWGDAPHFCWHGRHDVSTHYCSIVPPVGDSSMVELVECINLLNERFLVDKFLLFHCEGGGHGDA